ncbi:DUF2778 domain-containing protein [Phreatobacter aquaticus]|uniref:DUF2778 domain-containing protein n=2 Tax=Phreatobacter aquaticus TaxID=2570229 RepID=A0A4D7QMR7_9HYPH|nr:DUF2778 domain-containing protein [Phreatobacter aquaticus]
MVPLADVMLLGNDRALTTSVAAIDVQAPLQVAATPSRRHDPLMDPGFSLGMAPRPLGQSQPMSAAFQPASPPPATTIVLGPVEAPLPSPPGAVASLPSEAAVPEDESVESPLLMPAPRRELALTAPVPLPRPSLLVAPPASERPEIAARRTPSRSQIAATQPAPTDGRNFLERLFGAPQPSTPAAALGYASAREDLTEGPPRMRIGGPTMAVPVPQPGTAIYDISARTVYLPNGERLEAHSGLGPKRDDPRHVHVRMHGATPPHTYTLTEREALFHGVRAIRLNPVGGSGAIHGRAGLLAHTYMLGPNGDSNGCISFKDYNRFLQAFLRGEVRRLVVVAGNS